MNTKFAYILIGLLVVLSYSCENYDDLIPQEYNKILALKEVGEQDITLYNTGEDGSYSYTVMKGGNCPEATAVGNVRVMTEDELSEYAGLVGKSYTALPASTYSFADGSFSLSASETYSQGNIVLKTTEIKKILDQNTAELNYVLPVSLVSLTDSVNAKKKMLLLKPLVVTPVVDFVQASEQIAITGDATTYKFQLTLPFESLWDFDCTISVDETATLSGYNLVPNSEYSIENEGKVSFKQGSQLSEPITITINNSSLLGSSYFIPIKVESVSKQGFQIPQSNFILYTEFNKIDLTPSMLSTNAQEPTEGPIADLVDGNTATHFHSAWSVGVPEAHYFQINLTEAITNCSFAYVNRGNWNGKPQDVQIMVSSNGTDWAELTHITSGMPTGGGSSYSSDIFTASTPFSYFRFVVNKTNSGTAPTYFNMAEFSLYGK